MLELLKHEIFTTIHTRELGTLINVSAVSPGQNKISIKEKYLRRNKFYGLVVEPRALNF